MLFLLLISSMKIKVSFILNILISLVWFCNGIFCKILNLVPRHQVIVTKILGQEHSFLFTKLIGVAEVLMTVWVLSKIKSKWCAMVQILVILTMNIIEFFVVPELLLYGKMNIIFASIFSLIIYANEFYLKPKLQ